LDVGALPDDPRSLSDDSISTYRYNPVPKDAFDNEIFNVFYDPTSNAMTEDPSVFHRLSVLFIVLAIGALMDTTQPAYNIEAEKFHQLSRAALFQSPFFDCPTITAVQALVRDDFVMLDVGSLVPVFDDLLPLPVGSTWSIRWCTLGHDGYSG
jgi:hypothetical protein